MKSSFVNISEVNRQCLHSPGTRSEDDFEKVSIFTSHPTSGHLPPLPPTGYFLHEESSIWIEIYFGHDHRRSPRWKSIKYWNFPVPGTAATRSGDPFDTHLFRSCILIIWLCRQKNNSDHHHLRNSVIIHQGDLLEFCGFWCIRWTLPGDLEGESNNLKWLQPWHDPYYVPPAHPVTILDGYHD